MEDMDDSRRASWWSDPYVPRTSVSERRSPWHGLTGSEALELQDAECEPSRADMPSHERCADVAREYAARCVRALTGNDLRGAMRAASIAAAAWSTYERDREALQRSSERQSERQAVVDQDPSAGGRQGALLLARHRPDARRVTTSA